MQGCLLAKTRVEGLSLVLRGGLYLYCASKFFCGCAVAAPLALQPHPCLTSPACPHSEAQAVKPLLQLLHAGSQLAGGDRRTAIASLQVRLGC